MKKILIIEDEISITKQIKWGLGKDYEIAVALDANQGRSLLNSGVFPVVLLDLGLPPQPDSPREGLSLLSEISSLSLPTKVIVITGHGEEEIAVQAVAAGAADFCVKPIDMKLLKIILSRAFKIHELEEINRRFQRESLRSGLFCNMRGVSQIMCELFERIRQVSGTDYPVLITGETGTGKEMAAHAIHSLSRRSKGPLVIINCGAIPENLLESELFGYEKGAFTGAVSRKPGKFEQAEKGTIFLDEIGELPLPLQVKILRFVQEGTVERLGGADTITLDARIIAASNLNLEDGINDGRFREDLFHRLNVVPLKMPPLRKRDEDILLLAHHFLWEEAKKIERGRVSFAPAAIAAMNEYRWPGNVRELQNRIRRALGTTTARIIEPVDLGIESTAIELGKPKLPTLKKAREEAEVKSVQRALALTGNNISQAAALLSISRPTLHDLLKKHRIDLS